MTKNVKARLQTVVYSVSSISFGLRNAWVQAALQAANCGVGVDDPGDGGVVVENGATMAQCSKRRHASRSSTFKTSSVVSIPRRTHTRTLSLVVLVFPLIIVCRCFSLPPPHAATVCRDSLYEEP